jgi:hypothetical protein
MRACVRACFRVRVSCARQISAVAVGGGPGRAGRGGGGYRSTVSWWREPSYLRGRAGPSGRNANVRRCAAACCPNRRGAAARCTRIACGAPADGVQLAVERDDRDAAAAVDHLCDRDPLVRARVVPAAADGAGPSPPGPVRNPWTQSGARPRPTRPRGLAAAVRPCWRPQCGRAGGRSALCAVQRTTRNRSRISRSVRVGSAEGAHRSPSQSGACHRRPATPKRRRATGGAKACAGRGGASRRSRGSVGRRSRRPVSGGSPGADVGVRPTQSRCRRGRGEPGPVQMWAALRNGGRAREGARRRSCR